jgi:hypothetical protein
VWDVGGERKVLSRPLSGVYRRALQLAFFPACHGLSVSSLRCTTQLLTTSTTKTHACMGGEVAAARGPIKPKRIGVSLWRQMLTQQLLSLPRKPRPRFRHDRAQYAEMIA